MSDLTGLTAARMLAIEAACVVGGGVVVDRLILTKHDGSTIDAGNVRGPMGLTGNTGPTGPAGPNGSNGLAVRAIGASASIATGTTVYHAMPNEDFDQANSHDTTTNNSRLTCTSDGVYLCVAQVEYPSNATGNRTCGIIKNRTVVVGSVNVPACSGDVTRISAMGLIRLVASDYVEMYTVQNSGTTLVTVGSNTFVSMVRVSN